MACAVGGDKQSLFIVIKLYSQESNDNLLLLDFKVKFRHSSVDRVVKKIMQNYIDEYLTVPK